MNPTRYLIRGKAGNTQIEVRVNDIPVTRLQAGGKAMAIDVPVNEFLIAGTNNIQVIVHANPVPSWLTQSWSPTAPGAMQMGRPAAVELELVREEEGQLAPAFAPARLVWNGLAQPQPVSVTGQFHVGAPPAVWGWTRARALPPDLAIEPAYHVLERIWRTLHEGDVSTYETLVARKLEEVTSGAYGVEPGPLRAALSRKLGECLHSPDWHLLPCGRNDVDLRIVGQQRMVDCRRPNGDPALSFVKAGGNERFSLPTMLGHLDGNWQILR